KNWQDRLQPCRVFSVEIVGFEATLHAYRDATELVVGDNSENAVPHVISLTDVRIICGPRNLLVANHLLSKSSGPDRDQERLRAPGIRAIVSIIVNPHALRVMIVDR